MTTLFRYSLVYKEAVWLIGISFAFVTLIHELRLRTCAGCYFGIFILHLELN